MFRDIERTMGLQLDEWGIVTDVGLSTVTFEYTDKQIHIHMGRVRTLFSKKTRHPKCRKVAP